MEEILAAAQRRSISTEKETPPVGRRTLRILVARNEGIKSSPVQFAYITAISMIGFVPSAAGIQHNKNRIGSPVTNEELWKPMR